VTVPSKLRSACSKKALANRQGDPQVQALRVESALGLNPVVRADAGASNDNGST